MFGSVLLDVAIGMILVFLLMSLVASAIREGIEGYLKVRSRYLERGIRELLDQDGGLVDAVYAHPHVAGLYRGTYAEAAKNRELPSYVPARNFALALMDIAVRGRDIDSARDSGPDAQPMTAQSIRKNVARIENPRVQRLVLSALDSAADDLDRARKAIEQWFDAGMDRVAGWYRRQTTGILVAIGLALAIAMNVDAVRIFRSLYGDPAKREAAVAMASRIAASPASPGTPQTTTPATTAAIQARLDTVVNARLDSLNLPIGWPDKAFTGVGVFGHIIGWLLTAVAISFGAPFWFDLLTKVTALRSTIRPKEAEAGAKKEKAGAPAGMAVAGATTTPAVASAPATTTAGNGFTPHEWSSGFSQGGIL